jgi:hypothetical protein
VLFEEIFMEHPDAIWKHELDWLVYLQKCYTASGTSWERDGFKRQIEKSLNYLKDEVFFADLSFTHENGVYKCSSEHNDQERINYLNAVLKSLSLPK